MVEVMNVAASLSMITTSTIIPTVPILHFPIKKLVWELREVVLTHALFLPADGRVPDLLIALAADAKDEEGSLYEQARQIYYKINASLTYNNEFAFHHTALAKLQGLRHLKLVLPLFFNAQIITLQNELDSITIDMSKCELAMGVHKALKLNAVSILEFMNAASKNLHKLWSWPRAPIKAES